MERASQIRATSKDCQWLRRNPDLHSELLDLQRELKKTAARVTGADDPATYLMEAQAVGNRLRELFHTADDSEGAQPLLKA